MSDTHPFRRSILLAGAFLYLLGVSSDAAAGKATSVDLGQAPAGTIDEFEVEARNSSCDEPQNFRFVPRGTPWLKLVNGSTVRGVERGRTKIFSVQIDLTGLKPGRYRGLLDIICETCGDFVMSRCHIDTESVEILVEVVARGARNGQRGSASVSTQSN
jgi:hypothetical protein